MIRFAPLRLPFHRRLETLAVFFAISMLFLCLAVSALLLLASWETRVLWLLYAGWAILVDDAPVRGGRRVQWIRRLPVWRYLRDFFPCRLVKEQELDPQRNYLFGYHPHGIIGTGMWINFCTEATDVSRQFPGIQIHPMTLHGNLRVPIWREVLMAHGLCSVNRESFHHLLQSGPGQSVLVIPGGAREALDAHPGTVDLTIRNRKGFIRIALRNGCDLVPVFSFGENEIYSQVGNGDGSMVRRVQQFFLNKVGFAPCFPYGRGIFNYTLGFLPRRHPIHTIVGRPIRVPHKVSDPSEEEIQHYHQLYMQELERIYHAYKDKFHKNRTRDLRFK